MQMSASMPPGYGITVHSTLHFGVVLPLSHIMRNKVLHKDEHSPVDPAVGALTDQEKSGLLSNVAASVPRCPGLSSRRVRHGSRRAVCRRPNPHPRQNTSRSRLSRVARTRMLRGVEGGRGESRPGGSNLAPLSRRGQPA